MLHRNLCRNWLVAVAMIMTAAPAMAIEEPEYRIRQKTELFELRDYPPYLVAEARIKAPFENAGAEAFSILAGYIFGNNRSQQKIGMTAPVNQMSLSEKIEMTAPVSLTAADGGGEAYVISFVMPARFTLENLPTPLDQRVIIREMPARTMAVLSFSGDWSQSRYLAHETKLLAAVLDAGLQSAGKPVFARYNPPFMPWFLRRNEVMIEVQP